MLVGKIMRFACRLKVWLQSVVRAREHGLGGQPIVADRAVATSSRHVVPSDKRGRGGHHLSLKHQDKGYACGTDACKSRRSHRLQAHCTWDAEKQATARLADWLQSVARAREHRVGGHHSLADRAVDISSRYVVPVASATNTMLVYIVILTSTGDEDVLCNLKIGAKLQHALM